MAKLTLNRAKGVSLSRKGRETEEVQVAPQLGSFFGEGPAEPVENPLLSLSPKANAEETCNEEMSEVLRGIIEENQKRREAYRTMVDTEYFLCVCFQNRAQKDEFLQKAGWEDLGDKYLDGLEVAKRVGAEIEPQPVTIRAPKALSKKLRGIKLIGE